MACFVYVIAWKDAGPSKIGISDDPVQRLLELQIGNPYRLRIYAARHILEEDARVIERDILDRHADLRLVGEWLRMPPAMLIKVVDAVIGHKGLDAERWRPSPVERQRRRRTFEAEDKRKAKRRARNAADEYDSLAADGLIPARRSA